MPHALARKARQDQQRLRQLPVLHIAPVLRHSSKFSDNQKKDLTRRANQGYINIIARTDKARAEKSAAGFLLKYLHRTCRSVGPAQNILKLST